MFYPSWQICVGWLICGGCVVLSREEICVLVGVVTMAWDVFHGYFAHLDGLSSSQTVFPPIKADLAFSE